MFPEEIPHLKNEPLARFTSYRIGGPAEVLALPRTKEHLFSIGRYLLGSGSSYFVLGNGSNVLAPDEGFAGVVICTKELEPFLEFQGDAVHASAGTLNARILRACADLGLGGIDALSGVPGNLGGAVFMNAGTAAGWIAEALEEVTVIDLRGTERKILKEALRYSYRQQHYLQPGEMIWSARLQLKSEEPKTVKMRLAEALKKRKAAQPIELPSCGSVFRNPEGHNAWKLISDAGLRGFAKGGARISEKHCNFIVNEGGATREDVLYLIRLAKEMVLAQSGVNLHEEVVLLDGKILSL
jgi:UDP-N-acetylmuramate dehydrogenase